MFQHPTNGWPPSSASSQQQYQRVSTVEREGGGVFPDEVITKRGSPRWVPALVVGLLMFSFLLSSTFGRSSGEGRETVGVAAKRYHPEGTGDFNTISTTSDTDTIIHGEGDGGIVDGDELDANEEESGENRGDSQEEAPDGDGTPSTETEEKSAQTPDPCARSLLSKRPGRPNAMGVQFLHVPKAGGTSIQQTLWRWAERHDIQATHQDYGGPDWTLPKRVSPKNLGLLQGHRGYGYAKNVPEPVFVAVVLREPVSRFISLFDYTQYHRYMPVWRHRNLEEIILSYKHTRETCPECLLPNGNASISDKSLHQRLSIQLQFLCGYECVVWDLQQKQNLVDGGTHLANLPLRYSNEEMLRRAKENLRKCDAVAVLSHLDDLVVQLQIHLDWAPRDFTSWPHENTEQSHKMVRSKLTPETKAYLRSLMKEEVELYQYAETIASEKTREAKACLRKRRGGRS